MYHFSSVVHGPFRDRVIMDSISDWDVPETEAATKIVFELFQY